MYQVFTANIRNASGEIVTHAFIAKAPRRIDSVAREILAKYCDVANVAMPDAPYAFANGVQFVKARLCSYSTLSLYRDGTRWIKLTGDGCGSMGDLDTTHFCGFDPHVDSTTVWRD